MSYLHTLYSTRSKDPLNPAEREAATVRTLTRGGGLPLPIIFGTVDLTDIASSWFSLRNEGTDVYLRQQLAMCYGTLDSIESLYGGEKQIFGEVVLTDGHSVTINKPNLWGGDTGDGGIVGNINITAGLPTQEPDAELKTFVNQAVETDVLPAYKNIALLYFDNVNLGHATNIPNWRVRVVRTKKQADGSDQWYLDTAELIINGIKCINIVHVIRELITDQVWGLGQRLLLDADSFRDAANDAFQEKLGISTSLHDDVDILDFGRNLLRYLDAELYTNKRGLVTLRTIRQNYHIPDLPVLNESNVTEIQMMKRKQIFEATNTVTVIYTEMSKGGQINTQQSLTFQDLARIELVRGEVLHRVDYTACVSATTASVLALRDLLALGQLIISCEAIIVPSVGDQLELTDPIRVTWPDMGLDVIMRVVQIDYGDGINPEVKVNLIQDVFSTAGFAIFSDDDFQPPSVNSGWGFDWGEDWSQ